MVRKQKYRKLYILAFDFTGKSSIANSQPIKIDNTAPEQTTNQITIQGRHVSNMTSFNAW